MDLVIFASMAAIWVALLWFHPWVALGLAGLSLLLVLLFASVQIGVFVGERPKAEDHPPLD